MFRDKYTDFIFDDQHSSHFKVWMTNANDIQMALQPNFSNSFQTIANGQNRVYQSTNIEKQDIKILCAAINITQNEWRAISEWLSPLKEGKLVFEWDINHYFMVRLNSSSTGVIYDTGINNGLPQSFYNVTFELSFTTTQDWAALGRPTTNILNDNGNYNLRGCNYDANYFIPSVLYENKSNITLNSSEGQTIQGYWKTAVDNFNTLTAFSCDTSEVILSEGEFKNYNYYSYIDEEYVIMYFSYPVVIYSNNNAIIIPINDKVFYLSNAGTYSSYPLFEFYGIKTLLDDNKIYYQVESSNTDINPIITINNKEDIIYAGNNLIYNYRDANNALVYNDVTYNPIIIESGRPELMKLKMVDYNIIKRQIGETSINNSYHITFASYMKPVYERFKPFVCSIFTEDFLNQSNQYNIDSFDENTYDENNEMVKVLLNPIIKWHKENNIYIIDLYCGLDSKNSLLSLKEDTLKNLKSKKIYLSLCDYEEFYYDTIEDKEKSISITLQTRDVI